MTKDVVQIYASRQPRRPHHIEDWMNKRGLTAADLTREIGVDKSVVSRWLAGSTPSADWQAKLAALFNCEPEALFRHPDDDWMLRMLRGRTADEIERMKTLLETAFPMKRQAG